MLEVSWVHSTFSQTCLQSSVFLCTDLGFVGEGNKVVDLFCLNFYILFSLDQKASESHPFQHSSRLPVCIEWALLMKRAVPIVTSSCNIA